MPRTALRRFVATACAAAAVMTGVATLATAPSASAAPRLEVGVQFHGLWSSYSDADRAVVLDRLAESGSGWVRLDISWAMLQPRSRTEWSSDGLAYVDKVIDMAAARGLKVLGTFWITPSWANGGRGDRVLPNDPADYARAAKVIAARWATKVRAWEIWNEPNSSDFMVGADPAAYVGLAKAAYPGFHAGDPTTTVVSGGLQYVDDAWTKRAYAAGLAGTFDVMGVHPYPGVADEAPDLPDNGTVWRPAHVTALRSVMTANGDSAKPMWFTEIGWSTHDNTGLDLSDPASNWQRGVTLEKQAEYMTRLLDWSASLPYVTGVFWYAERDRTVAAGSSFATLHNARFGLLDVSLRPKPAWTALRAWNTASAPAPTATATASPTATATASPTVAPTVAATVAPTVSPTVSVTVSPTVSPTVVTTPTAAPTVSPTLSPTVSPSPTTTTRVSSKCLRVGRYGFLKYCRSSIYARFFPYVRTVRR